MQEVQIQILEITKTKKDKSKKTGKPYVKKWLSVMLNGEPTEVSAFTKPWKEFHLNVGELYNGNITESQYGLQFEATERIIDSNEPPVEPPAPHEAKPPEPKPTHLKEEPKAISEYPGEFNPPPPKATPPIYGKHFDDKKDDSVSKTTTMTPEGTKEVTYTHEDKESKKEKSMRKMNILNNAVAKLCATIKISKPVGGDGKKQVIAFGDAHFNIDDLLKKYILEFKKYYTEE